MTTKHQYIKTKKSIKVNTKQLKQHWTRGYNQIK